MLMQKVSHAFSNRHYSKISGRLVGLVCILYTTIEINFYVMPLDGALMKTTLCVVQIQGHLTLDSKKRQTQ